MRLTVAIFVGCFFLGIGKFQATDKYYFKSWLLWIYRYDCHRLLAAPVALNGRLSSICNFFSVLPKIRDAPQI